MRAWAAALLLLTAAATAREVVRLGYFTEAQPFEVACARGWFEAADLDVEVVCLPQSAGVGAVSKIDDGDLDVALLGSTPAAEAIARGVKLENFYVAHLKGESQALLVRPEIVSPCVEINQCVACTIILHFALCGVAVRIAETRTQKHRRANLPRRTSAFSSRHDDNV